MSKPTSLTQRYALHDNLTIMHDRISLRKKRKNSAQASKLEQSGSEQLPPPMPVPAAMARLSALYGLPNATSEESLIEDYTAAPGREALSMLCNELGVKVRVTSGNLNKFSDQAFPLVAITTGGSAVILYRLNSGTYRVIGMSDETTLDIATLGPHLSGTFLIGNADEDAATDAADGRAGTRISEVTERLMRRNQIIRWIMSQGWQHHRPVMIQLLLASLVSNLFLLSLPLFIMSVYDRVIPHSAFESLQTLAIGIAIVFAADAGLRFAKLKFVDSIGLSLSRSLQQHLYRRLLHMPLTTKPTSAAPMNAIQGEVESLCLLTPDTLICGFSDVCFAVLVLFLIGAISGPVVIAPILGTGVAIAVIVSAANAAHEGAKHTVALRTAANGQVAETFDALTAVKATGAEQILLSRFERTGMMAAAKSHTTRHRIRFATNAAGIIVQATIVLTIILGVMRIDQGLMTIGTLAAITILVGRAVMPAIQLSDQLCRLRSIRDIVTNALNALPEDEEKGGESNGAHDRKIGGAFKLKQVSFTHRDCEAPILSNITLNIQPGEKIGIIGRNGSGKSTLMHLFPRLYEPTSGTLLVDEYDARQYTPRRLRRDVGFMAQETVLFNQSLRDNICLGVSDISDEAFANAVHLSGVDRFARVHPHGYSMLVGPRGEYLSAGERQAVGLARVLLRPRPVLILDEPTSLMDQTAEAHIIATLAALPASTTLILSTHRLRLLDAVDRLITIDTGTIIADGSKAQVLASMKKAA